jgi:hypothetical protein
VTAENVTLNGMGYNLTGDSDDNDEQGVYGQGVYNLTVRNISIYNFGRALHLESANYSSLEDVNVHNSTTVGVQLVNSQRVKSSNLYINNTGETSIELDSGSGNSSFYNVTVENGNGDYGVNSSSGDNFFNNLTGVMNRYATLMISGENNTVQNVYVNNFGTTDDGLYVVYGNNNYIVNLTVLDSDSGIEITESSNNTFENVFINDSSFALILEDQSTNNTFINLTLEENFQNILGRDSNSFQNFNETKFVDSILGENYNFCWSVTTCYGGTITINDTTDGVIKFLEPVNGTSSNLTYDIQISNNYAFVNSSQTGLNVSANVTFYSMPGGFSNPVILKDGVECTDCWNFTSLNSGTVKFNVTSWSNYTIGEEANPNEISACPINITSPGVYNLTRNLQYDGDCIRINASHVVLNGHGYQILGGAGYKLREKLCLSDTH